MYGHLNLTIKTFKWLADKWYLSHAPCIWEGPSSDFTLTTPQQTTPLLLLVVVP